MQTLADSDFGDSGSDTFARFIVALSARAAARSPFIEKAVREIIEEALYDALEQEN